MPSPCGERVGRRDSSSRPVSPWPGPRPEFGTGRARRSRCLRRRPGARGRPVCGTRRRTGPGIRSTAVIAFSSTISVSPSEQSRSWSPSSRRDFPTSTWTKAPRVAIALVRTCRAGCVATSSGVMAPASASDCAIVWSRVRRERRPSRKTYARESPTCVMSRSGPSVQATVIVVAMPRSAGSSLARSSRTSRTFWKRRSMRCRTSWARGSSRRMIQSGVSITSSTSAWIAVRLATSPAAAPPTPSATRYP